MKLLQHLKFQFTISRFIQVFLIIVLLASCKEGTFELEEEPEVESSEFKVVGYLNGSIDTWNTDMDLAPIDQLTDIIFAFINPDANGDFILNAQQQADVSSAVSKGHNSNLRVYLSFAGGYAPAFWDELIKPTSRTYVISNLRQLVTTYNFDGIDVDLENARITSDYSDFVIELSDTLRNHKKLLTAAVVNYSSERISDAALQRYDFLNIMGYDFNYPGHPDGPGHHSKLSQLKVNYDYYRGRNIPADKIVLGVPAYAVGFGTTPTWRDYKLIIADYPHAYAINYKYPTPNSVYYYDGHPAIREKVKFALEEGVAGMMMWQIMGDTQDSTSLLRLINHCKTDTAGFYNTQYKIINKVHWKALEVADGSLTDGANIRIAMSPSSTSLYWNIDHLGNQNFSIKNANSAQYMSVAEQSTANGANILQLPWQDTNNQKFELSSNWEGYYFIKNVGSNKVLEATENAGDGANVVQETSIESDKQQWVIWK